MKAEQWKHEYEVLDACLELAQGKIAELKAENDRLKRENEIITGMHNSSSNRFDKLYNTLQEIKYLAESKVKPNLVKRMNGTAMYGISKIIELTKAEEE